MAASKSEHIAKSETRWQLHGPVACHDVRSDLDSWVVAASRVLLTHALPSYL